MVLAGLSLMTPAVLRPVPVVPEGIYQQSMGARAYNAGDMTLALTFYERAAIESPRGTSCWYESHVAAAQIHSACGDFFAAQGHLDELERFSGGSR